MSTCRRENQRRRHCHRTGRVSAARLAVLRLEVSREVPVRAVTHPCRAAGPALVPVVAQSSRAIRLLSRATVRCVSAVRTNTVRRSRDRRWIAGHAVGRYFDASPSRDARRIKQSARRRPVATPHWPMSSLLRIAFVRTCLRALKSAPSWLATESRDRANRLLRAVSRAGLTSQYDQTRLVT
jgi:hypothetical protein